VTSHDCVVRALVEWSIRCAEAFRAPVMRFAPCGLPNANAPDSLSARFAADRRRCNRREGGAPVARRIIVEGKHVFISLLDPWGAALMTRALERGPEFLFLFAPPMCIHHDDSSAGDSLRGPCNVARAGGLTAFDGAGVWIRVNGSGNLRQGVTCRIPNVASKGRRCRLGMDSSFPSNTFHL